MRRRELIAGAAAFASVTFPVRAYAQPARTRPLLGILIDSTPDTDPNTQAFVDGLSKLGYVAGQSIAHRIPVCPTAKPERLPALAAELVSLKPDMIYALGGEVTP